MQVLTDLGLFDFTDLHHLLIKILISPRNAYPESVSTWIHLINKFEAMKGTSLPKSSEGHPNAVLCLPQFPSESPPFDEERSRLIEEYRKANYEEKAAQTVDDESPNKSFEKSLRTSIPKHTSSIYLSQDYSEPFDIRE